MQDSSSINSVAIDEFQKDLWFKKSLKSIESINNSKKKQDNYISNSDKPAFTERNLQAKANEDYSEISNASKSFSNVSNELRSYSEEHSGISNIIVKEKNTKIDDVNKNKNRKVSDNAHKFNNANKDYGNISADYNSISMGDDNLNKNNKSIEDDNASIESTDTSIKSDSISIGNDNIIIQNNNSSTRSDNASVENDNQSIKNDNITIKNDNQSIKNKNVNLRKDNEYKNNINWEIKQFNDIFDINNPILPKKSPKHHSRKHQKFLNEIQNQPAEKNASIDSEVGQLELPSSTLVDVYPHLGSSEMEIEINFFQNGDNYKSPQSSYISHKSNSKNANNQASKESPIRSRNSTSPKNVRKKAQDKNNFTSFNNNQMPFAANYLNSDSNSDVALQFQKNAKILSSQSNSEAEKHEDKTVSKQGIVLFLLSSSDTEETEKAEKATKALNLDEVDQVLSTASSSIAHEDETNNILSKSVTTPSPKQGGKRKSKNEANSNSAEQKREFSNSTLSESNLTSSEKESAQSSARSGKRRRQCLTASLTVVQAHGLPSLNVPRRDPYCSVGFKGCRDSLKTKVIRDTTSPIWNSKFNFDVKNIDDPLRFSIRYEDKFGGDIEVAEGELNLKMFEIGKFVETWIRLRPTASINITPTNDEEKAFSSISSACEMYVTIVLEPKAKKNSPRNGQLSSSSSMLSPRTPQQNAKELSLLSASSSSYTKGRPKTPLKISPSPKIERYEGELTMTITIVEAKNITSQFFNSGFYCAVNVVGRKDIRKTKTVFGSSSPIWDKQFKFTLANWKDYVAFSVRVEDRSKGDFAVARKVVSVDEIPLNCFVDKWVTLGAVKELKRLPVRDSIFAKKSKREERERSDIDDDDLSKHDYSELDDEDVDVDENLEAGQLHFNLVLEPRIKEVEVSPRLSPSPIGINTYNNFGYPDSPMSYFIPKQSENDEN